MLALVISAVFAIQLKAPLIVVPAIVGCVVLGLTALAVSMYYKNRLKTVVYDNDQDLNPSTPPSPKITPKSSPKPSPVVDRKTKGVSTKSFCSLQHDWNTLLAEYGAVGKILNPDKTLQAKNVFTKQMMESLIKKFFVVQERYNYQHEVSVGRSNVYFMQRPITRFPVFIEEAIAVFNAANDTMYTGGSGTNKALSEAVTPESWESSKGGRTRLKEGDATLGDFTSRNHFTRLKHRLGQILGPEGSSNPDLFKAYNQLRNGYMNAMTLTRANGVNVIQLPIVSSGAFAGTGPWSEMVKMALISALLANGDSQDPLTVIVVDYDKIPMAEEMLCI